MLALARLRVSGKMHRRTPPENCIREIRCCFLPAKLKHFLDSYSQQVSQYYEQCQSWRVTPSAPLHMQTVLFKR